MTVIELHAALCALIEQGHGGLVVARIIHFRDDLWHEEIDAAKVIANGIRIDGPLVELE